MAGIFNGGRLGITSRKTVNALGIFSGVQTVTVICGIIRAKLIAILIGPAGTGIFSLLNTLISTVATVIDMGLRQSAVRLISIDEAKRRIRSSSILMWTVFVSIITSVAILIFAPSISKVIPYGRSMSLWIRIVSIAIVFTSVSQAISAVFQGYGLLGRLAKSSIWGAVTGLLVTIPLLYFFKLKGLVFSILAYSLCSAIITVAFCYGKSLFDFRRKIGVYVKEYRTFLSFAVYLSASTVITQLTFYFFMLWVNQKSSAETVGLWQAGVSITDRYAGIIITALAFEFYPRLCSMHESRYRLQVACRHEVQFINNILMAVAPLLALLSPFLVKLLYSTHFSPSTVYVIVSAIGIPLRASSYCVAYVILAKGDGKIYLGTELASALLYMILGTFAFKDGGIAGLGVAYSIWYLCYFIIVAAVCWLRYGISLSMRQWITVVTAVFLTGVAGLITLSVI